MDADFVVHWSLVDHARAALVAGAGRTLVALWPAPVNADSCFEEAGFAHFADHDAAWEDAAGALRERLLEWLARFGAPELLSQPLLSQVPWYRRLFEAPEPLPLALQIDLPIHWDDLPPCRLRFGRDVELLVGHGHELYWIALPAAELPVFEAALPWLADGCPCVRTPLRWDTLLPHDPGLAMGALR